MHFLKLELRHFAMHPRYESILILGGLLSLAITISLLGVLAYVLGFDQQQSGQLISIQAVFVLLAGALLFLLYKTREVVPIGYALGFIYLILLCVNALIWKDAPTLYLTWLTLFPLTLVFSLSTRDLLLGVLIVCVCVFFMQPAMEMGLGFRDWGTYYQQQDKRFLLTLIPMFSAAFGSLFMVMLRLYTSKHQQATRDHLTGLFNRYMLEQESAFYLQHYQRTGKVFFIIFLDLDRFKEVNELFGHAVGDQILALLGKRLQQLCVDNEQRDSIEVIEAFRFGGDEFLLLLRFAPEVNEEAEVLELLKRIRADIEARYDLGRFHIAIESSIGVTRSIGEVDNAEDLIRFANFSMFENKHARHLNYSSRQQDGRLKSWNQRQRFIWELEKTPYDSMFRLLYQPIYDADSLQICGCEALLRIHSDVLGEMVPDEFIPVAETSGLIQGLNEWVIRRVLQDMRHWLEQFPELVVSLNISPFQLRENGFVPRLQDLLAAPYARYRTNLEFELTETSSITNSRHIAHTLQEMHALGIKLSLDDFGQGNTSFLELKQGAFSVVKIDKSLLWEAFKNASDRQILEATINSVRSLGLQITAEGIETNEHLQLAKKLGCNKLQGFLLSSPLSVDAFGTLLANMRRGDGAVA